MKKTTLVILIVTVFSLSFNAQTFTLMPKTFTGVASCSGISEFHVALINNGSSALTLSYAMLDISLPDTNCWTMAFCDCNTCLQNNDIPTSGGCFFGINAGDTSHLFMDLKVINTKGNIGWGTLQYLIYETGNPSNSDTITFNFTGCSQGVFCATGISKTITDHFNVYPSISSGTLFIEGDNLTNIAFIDIFDGIGKNVYSQKNADFNNNKMEISTVNLPNGVYFLKLYEENYFQTKMFIVDNKN